MKYTEIKFTNGVDDIIVHPSLCFVPVENLYPHELPSPQLLGVTIPVSVSIDLSAVGVYMGGLIQL